MRKRKGKVNIVHYVTHQYMMQNKKRTITTFVGILFMVLLMTCVYVGKDTAIGFLQEAASAREGKWHYALQNITDAQLVQIQKLDYVCDMEESVPLGMAVFAQSANKERPYLNIKAYGEKCFAWYNVKLAEGRFPRQEHEIVLSIACKNDGADIKTGDMVTAAFFRRSFTGTQKNKREKTIFPCFNFLEIQSGQTVEVPEQFPYFEPNEDFRENREMTGTAEEYKVVGFIEVPVYEKKDGAGYTALTLLDQKRSAEAEVRNISLKIDADRVPPDAYEELKAIAGEENIDVNNYYLAFTGNSSDSTMNLMVRMMTVFFTAVIMAASILLIYNVFNLSFRERCRYLGMLSSVGATARQKRSSIYYEAFYLLLFALPAGILAGFCVIRGGMELLKPFLIQFASADGMSIADIPVRILVSWKGILTAAAVSTVTVLISAFMPARAISRRGAVESIRGNENQNSRTYRMSRLAYQKHGAVKMLAGSMLARQRKKKRSISLSVIVFLVILIVTAFGADTIHIVLDLKTRGDTVSGIEIQENEGVLSHLSYASRDEAQAASTKEKFTAIIEELKNHKNVQKMTLWYEGLWCGQIPYAEFYSKEYLDARMNIAKAYLGRQMSEEEILKNYFTDSSTSVSIFVMDDHSLQDIAKRCGADAQILADTSRMGVLAVNEVELSTDNTRYEGGKPQRFLYYDIAAVSDMDKGDSFSAFFADADSGQEVQQQFTVAGYADETALKNYVSLNGDSTWLIMGTKTAELLADKLGCDDLSGMFEEEVKIEFTGDSSELEAYLCSLIENNDDIAFFNKDVLNAQKTMIQALAEMTDIMLICFVILTSVICFMNLGNSIGGRMAGRRMEFAVMKSAGMTRKQIRQMLFLECCGILGSAVITALCISAALVCGIRYVLSSWFGRLVLRIPFLFIIFAVSAGVSAVFFMTFYSFGKEKEQNILEEIRRETV